MLRRTWRGFQLQRQLHVDSLAYSAAFAPRNECDASLYQQATALYSPAMTSIRRRKWHAERQKKYEAKRKVIGAIARNDLGMAK